MNINCFICQYKRTTAANFSTFILQMKSEVKLVEVIIAGNQIFLNPDLTASRRKTDWSKWAISPLFVGPTLIQTIKCTSTFKGL